MRRALLALPLALLACVQTPELRPYPWKLVSIGGKPFAATATFALDESGKRVSGQAPCNTWSGRIVTTPSPEWAIRDVVSTEMACPDLAAEQEFYAGLARATHMAVGIGYLRLTDTKGFTMEFVPLAP
ncbi:META domain-containing protein [Rhodobacter sp. SGA-6-6]|uniref:META domain-containing protein n=1 Tax=Rhodobacter sp. SGA-6-6 TaxID=2710882 RepID=UPI0013ED5186|nr:META domain-containing protein [Rhodobacter sp. SGA-6-6]NGM45676.1 META domain-containing protein [Rhodobacter sp. SGA-6-6]